MKQEITYPAAEQAPQSACTWLTDQMASKTLAHAAASPRRRFVQRLHKNDDDPYHRMFNALQPGTYIRPHRHLDPPKSESMLVLRGLLRVVIFADDGEITECRDLAAGTDAFGVDLLPQVYHTIIALVPDTLIFESKTGPYSPITDKGFAPWAPAEDDAAAASYLDSLMRRAQPDKS